MLHVDVCVIGAGSGGLTVAAGAAQMGAKVALVEKGRMGGDCLNTGCVPSKSLLAAAERAQAIRESANFGIGAGPPRVEWGGVNRHVRKVIANIAPNDSQERFEGLGVRVIRAHGAFIDKCTLQAGNVLIRAKFFVLATGSSPFIPHIEGLGDIDYFTNENIFDNRESIGHLIVIGGGPIGLEMAQAHRRLGSEVTVMEVARLLVKDDPELAAVVIGRLKEEGIAFYEGGRNLRVEKDGDAVAVYCETDMGKQCMRGTHLLLATGRRPNVRDLNLEAAGVEWSPQGITVDARLRTSNRRIYAVGDVVGPYPFTHMASYQAGIVIRNILFRIPARVNYSAVPWVTYTDPELAHVGMSEGKARAEGMKVRVLRWHFADNDRAQAERRTEGLLKVVTTPGGRILGVDIAALHAGELILPWVLAVERKMKIGAMASLIAPYPTLSEASKRIAGSFYTPNLYSERTRRLVRFLLRL